MRIYLSPALYDQLCNLDLLCPGFPPNRKQVAITFLSGEGVGRFLLYEGVDGVGLVLSRLNGVLLLQRNTQNAHCLALRGRGNTFIVTVYSKRKHMLHTCTIAHDHDTVCSILWIVSLNKIWFSTCLSLEVWMYSSKWLEGRGALLISAWAHSSL